jgi:co-chaperonin GroES (HSP10)
MIRCPQGKVILKPEYKEQKTVSGIILDEAIDRAREKNALNKAEVYLSNNPDIPVGAVAHYRDGTYWKNEVRVNQDEFNEDGLTLLCVDEKDILCVELNEPGTV